MFFWREGAALTLNDQVSDDDASPCVREKLVLTNSFLGDF